MKPILFNTEEVCATLDGRKSAKRLVVKDVPPAARLTCVSDDFVTFRWQAKAKNANVMFDKEQDVVAPYRPGDILYVRETWAMNYDLNYDYAATPSGKPIDGGRWRPSTHMPREAARIWLRVTDVRVERLQDITPGDCVREGIPYCVIDTLCVGFCDSCGTSEAPQRRFQRLWDSTIKPADRERYGWAANPWVWVISFERCEKPEEAEDGRIYRT